MGHVSGGLILFPPIFRGTTRIVSSQRKSVGHFGNAFRVEGHPAERSNIEILCCFPQSLRFLRLETREALANQLDARCASGFPQTSLLVPSPFSDCRCLCGSDVRQIFLRELFPAHFPQAGILSGTRRLGLTLIGVTPKSINICA